VCFHFRHPYSILPSGAGCYRFGTSTIVMFRPSILAASSI
jgi:hypothetical protein